MPKESIAYSSIDEYIAGFPTEIQKKLQTIRTTLKEAVPDAQEKISYQMPTFYLHGNLVSFGAFKNHISFFPGAINNIQAAFTDEIAVYMTGKGTLQFPDGKPLPLELVRRIANYRAEQNRKKAAEKARKVKSS